MHRQTDNNVNVRPARTLRSYSGLTRRYTDSELDSRPQRRQHSGGELDSRPGNRQHSGSELDSRPRHRRRPTSPSPVIIRPPSPRRRRSLSPRRRDRPSRDRSVHFENPGLSPISEVRSPSNVSYVPTSPRAPYSTRYAVSASESSESQYSAFGDPIEVPSNRDQYQRPQSVYELPLINHGSISNFFRSLHDIILLGLPLLYHRRLARVREKAEVVKWAIDSTAPYPFPSQRQYSIQSQPYPSYAPSVLPSHVPSVLPSYVPSVLPSYAPSVLPSYALSVLPQMQHSVSIQPEPYPSYAPSYAPSALPMRYSIPPVPPVPYPSHPSHPTVTSARRQTSLGGSFTGRWLQWETFGDEWESFVSASTNEWQTLNIISALLLR